MAQQRGAPDRRAVGDLDPVLATKLYVPPRQPGFVPRPRLVEALDEGLARTLYLVSAPAGFGKTVALLADWGHNSERVLAWLSLDAGDIDPVRFCHAIAALDRVRPGLATRLGPLLGPPAPPSFEGLVTTLVNELVARPDDDQPAGPRRLPPCRVSSGARVADVPARAPTAANAPDPVHPRRPAARSRAAARPQGADGAAGR